MLYINIDVFRIITSFFGYNNEFAAFVNGKFMWRTMRDIFQMWFLGDDLFKKTFGYDALNSGKIGLLYKEEPIVSPKSVRLPVVEGYNLFLHN